MMFQAAFFRNLYTAILRDPNDVRPFGSRRNPFSMVYLITPLLKCRYSIITLPNSSVLFRIRINPSESRSNGKRCVISSSGQILWF